MMNNLLNQNFSINQLPILLNQINDYMLKINEIIIVMNNIINFHINSQNNIFLNPMNNFINYNQNINPVFKEDEKNLINVFFHDKSNLTTVFATNDISELDLLTIYFNKINRADLVVNHEKELQFYYNGIKFGDKNK